MKRQLDKNTSTKHSRPRESGELGNPGIIWCIASIFLGPRLALCALGNDIMDFVHTWIPAQGRDDSGEYRSSPTPTDQIEKVVDYEVQKPETVIPALSRDLIMGVAHTIKWTRSIHDARRVRGILSSFLTSPLGSLVLTALLNLLLLHPAHAVIQNVSQSSQTDVDITLYPQDIALIKEKRKTFLKEGSNKLLIKDVPSDILVDSFIFQIISPSIPVKVLEYNFQASQITRGTLLQHSIGEKVNILPSHLVPMPQTGKLLALDGDECVIDSEGQIFVLNKNRISFSHLPYTLVPEPLITLKVDNPKEGDYVFNMGYLAKGFSWDAGYTIVLDATATHLDLNNWINIHNNSGMDITKGHFLIAHTQDMKEHFYDIEKPISLSDNAVKNISWFSALGLTPSTSFRIFPKNKITEDEEGVVIKPTVETWLSVQNDRSHGLGVPLPEGVIKVFRRNSAGSLFYVGENKTPFVPVEKAFSLRVGSTRAISAEMRQTDFRKLGSQVVESGYRIDLKNETKTPKQVTIFQAVTGNWTILRETHPHEEEDKRVEWTITLAPQEEVSLRYRIRMNVK